MRRKTTHDPCITRFADPIDNLLYNILLQALRDNDIDYLRHDGGKIWDYLRTRKTK